MERRFDVRLEELLDDAVLDSRIPEGMLDRLEGFVKPFAAIMEGLERQRHLWEYVAGLFSDVKRKNAETIGSRSAWGGPRVMRGWPSIKFATGLDGTIIKHSHCWLRGS